MPLRIQQLRHRFLGEEILCNLDLTFSGGEFSSILGASGCGKSTLLRLIAGLLSPSSGSIAYQEEPDFGFVFQKPTLLPWLTAIKNVALPLNLDSDAGGLVRKTSQMTRAADALDLVGLHGIDQHKLPHELSGGMQMRVSLARAFVTKPSVMLMDEPFSALDEVLRQQLCETTLRLWKQEGWTTVFVTHNVQEAVFLSQRIHILAEKPARVVDTINIPFDARTPDLRASPKFLQVVADVGKRLREVVEQDQAAAMVETGVPT